MNRLLSRNEFTKAINSYEDMWDFYDDINNVFQNHHRESNIFPSSELDTIISLLQFIFDDKEQWISYWIYELDFGSKYQDGMIQDKDGNNIQLKTVDDLYDLLTGGLYARNDIT